MADSLFVRARDSAEVFWVRSRRVRRSATLPLGWTATAAFSQLLKLRTPGLLLIGAGCHHDPVPHAFGYHELFHLRTLAAAGCY
jgi:hypothetical protein